MTQYQKLVQLCFVTSATRVAPNDCEMLSRDIVSCWSESDTEPETAPLFEDSIHSCNHEVLQDLKEIHERHSNEAAK